MTKTVTIKTSELIGLGLCWGVGLACMGRKEPIKVFDNDDRLGVFVMSDEPKGLGETIEFWVLLEDGQGDLAPSSNWKQGGELIKRFGISLLSPEQSLFGHWHASLKHPDFDEFTHPDNPLIAACRAIAASKLGDTVEVPVALVGGDA